MKDRINFDDYTKNYEQLLADQLSFFDGDAGYFAEYKVELTHQLVNSQCSRLLDFGCGIGRSIPYFQKYFSDSEIYGCDLSLDSIEWCRANFPYGTFSLTGELPKDLKFDLVFAAGVWHHIPTTQRQEALQFCREHLSPGGTLIIFEHNPYNPVTRRMVSTCEFDADAVLLKRRELISLMRSAGFEKFASGYTLFFPHRLRVLRRLEGWLRRMPLGGQYYVRATRDR